MPKIVDHDSRRKEIIQAVWTLIAQRGMDAVTMRELAAQAGYANGALASYFRSKDDILHAAYEHAFRRTNERAALALGQARGLDALRLLSWEIMPLDEERLFEARVVIAFWDRAASHPRMTAVHKRTMDQWRTQFKDYLNQARQTGEVTTATPDERLVDMLMSMLVGLQINAVLLPGDTTPDRQHAMLDDFLALVA